jgi:hypothetical protein
LIPNLPPNPNKIVKDIFAYVLKGTLHTASDTVIYHFFLEAFTGPVELSTLTF